MNEERLSMGAIYPLHWLPVKDGDPRARALYRRHYSCRQYADGRKPVLFVGPGEKMVLMTVDCAALWVWRRFMDASGQQGVNNAVFRNEGATLSSALVTEACELAWLRWPGERLYTYVNAEKIRHKRDPGRCFVRAGWRQCGMTQGGLLVFEMLPGVLGKTGGEGLMSKKRIPAETFPVGIHILEEMAARGWDIAHFCEATGFTLAEADAIIDGRQAITPLIALTLGLTFDVSEEFWRNLDARHAEWRKAKDATESAG